MPETTPLIKAALNLRVGAGFDVYDSSVEAVSITNEIRIVQVKKYYMDRSLLNIYLIFYQWYLYMLYQ